MADAIETIRQGAQRPFFGSAKAPGGTLTISIRPRCTLYDAAGQAVAGFDNIEVTGYDAAAAQTVRAWLSLDTTNLSPGSYTLVFKIQATASDTIPRTFCPSVAIDVESVLRVVGSPGLPATAYAGLADVQARIPRQLWQSGPTAQPSDQVVLGWLEQVSAWIDTTFRWKYVVPVTDPADAALLRPVAAMLVAAQIWDVLGGHGDDQPNGAATLRKEARILLAYDAGSGLRVASGQSQLVLPNTTLAEDGEAVVMQAAASFSDPDVSGNQERFFTMGRDL